jgi:hypothetical protein
MPPGAAVTRTRRRRGRAAAPQTAAERLRWQMFLLRSEIAMRSRWAAELRADVARLRGELQRLELLEACPWCDGDGSRP